jgi:ankyrin repeat protein
LRESELIPEKLDWAKNNLKTQEIKNTLLLATESRGNTAWHCAAREDIKTKLLLATDSDGKTAGHLAAFRGN